MRNAAQCVCLGALIVLGLALAGCAPQSTAQTQPSPDMYERQQQAMKHPLEYTPFQENPDISGGGIGDFDPKSFGKDLHDFFNP